MTKSYYAIIPANVRYDKELTPNAKLLYGEITALTNEKGYCWATNAYFAELYSTTNRSVSKWISQLESRGYIDVYQKRGQKGVTVERKITLAGTNVPEAMEENFHTPKKETSNVILHNNNTVNTTSKQRFTPPEVGDIIDYCNHRKNKIDGQHFHDWYASKGWMVGKTKMKDWKACIRTWERRDTDNAKTKKADPMTRLQDTSWADHLTN